MVEDDILNGLTDAQREAVTHVDGPLLVVAGAGSGKTRVITRRVAYLISRRIRPWNILAITFTNKAANEMKERIAHFVDRPGVWVSTFHAMCARMLRQYPKPHGVDPNFTIADTDDQRKLIQDAMNRLQLSKENFPPSALAAAISRAKNNLMSAEQFAEHTGDFFHEKAAAVYRTYQKMLDDTHLLDFDDLLMKVALLLRNDAEFLQFWTDRFHYILIDEYQDTNHAQYWIARQLAAERRNLCATGDPDQSIYGWRGADISNILEFRRDYPDARIVKLEKNYRSTKTILAAANAVIAHNRQRFERGMHTDNPDGQALRIIHCADEESEARDITREIRRFRQQGIPFGEMAIFYRTHAQSRPIEQELFRAGLPYTLLDAVAFYARQEIKNALAYARLCVNPADDVSFERIVNLPPRGIGDVTLEALRQFAQQNGISLVEALLKSSKVPALTNRAQQALESFADLYAELRETAEFPVAQFFTALLERTGYRAYLESRGEQDRVENLAELVNAAARYDEGNPEGSLMGFLEQASLVSDADKTPESADSVSLMTLHSAKGLEFRAVFIVGCEENLLPHVSSMDNESELEEERRLFYVGMTRAKEQLALSWTAMRARWGQSGMCLPSRFLKEIPQSLLQQPSKADDSPAHVQERLNAILAQMESRRPARRARPHRAAPEEEPREHVIELEPDELATGDGLAPGDRVRHAIFGDGSVVELSGSRSERRARVRFDRAGVKTLVLKYSRLVKLMP